MCGVGTVSDRIYSLFVLSWSFSVHFPRNEMLTTFERPKQEPTGCVGRLPSGSSFLGPEGPGALMLRVLRRRVRGTPSSDPSRGDLGATPWDRSDVSTEEDRSVTNKGPCLRPYTGGCRPYRPTFSSTSSIRGLRRRGTSVGPPSLPPSPDSRLQTYPQIRGDRFGTHKRTERGRRKRISDSITSLKLTILTDLLKRLPSRKSQFPWGNLMAPTRGLGAGGIDDDQV